MKYLGIVKEKIPQQLDTARRPDTIEKTYDEVYHRFNEIYSLDINELSRQGRINIDIDGYHETMKRLSEELGFDYERKKKNT